MKKVIASICCVLCCILSLLYCVDIGGVYAENDKLSSVCKSSFLVDFNTGTVLFEHNADEKSQIASIVKLMTILLTIEDIEEGKVSLEDKVSTTEHAAGMGGSQVFIDPYVEYSIDDMLKSVIVASANDASVVLAEKLAGSEEAFVSRMNKRAIEIGMNNTKYANASGLPQPEQFSTARDVAKLMSEVMKHKLYFDYSTIWMDELIHPSGRKTEVVNTNKLIRYFKGCDAGKTGSTDEAGCCLVSSAQRGNMRLVAVVLGAKTSTERFNESSKLLNYGFTNYENKSVVNISDSLKEVNVLKSKTKSAPIFAKNDFFGLTKKGEKIPYEVNLEIPDTIKAPIKAGETVGKIIVSKDGAIVKEIEAVVGAEIERISYGSALKDVITNW